MAMSHWGLDIRHLTLTLPVRSRITTYTKSSGYPIMYRGMSMVFLSEQSQPNRPYRWGPCMFTLIYGCRTAILPRHTIPTCYGQMSQALTKHIQRVWLGYRPVISTLIPILTALDISPLTTMATAAWLKFGAALVCHNLR